MRTIYTAIQQILEAVFQQEKSAFSRVALVEYPRRGLFSLAFVTAETKGVVKNAAGEETWSVFIPTTPNPTSGYLLFIPKKETIILNIPVEQAAKLIMSAGVLDERKALPRKKINIQRIMQFFTGKN